MAEDIENLIDFISRYFKVDRNLLYSKKWDNQSSLARHFTWYIIHCDYGISISTISREFFKNRRSIFWGINKIREGIKHQKYYRNIYEDLTDKYKKERHQ